MGVYRCLGFVLTRLSDGCLEALNRFKWLGLRDRNSRRREWHDSVLQCGHDAQKEDHYSLTRAFGSLHPTPFGSSWRPRPDQQGCIRDT